MEELCFGVWGGAGSGVRVLGRALSGREHSALATHSN